LAGLNRTIERTIASYPRIFRPVARRLVPRLSGTAVASHRLAGFILACLGSSIGQHVVARTRLRTNQPIDVYRGTAVGEGIIENGIYEPETADLIARILRPGMCFLDIGANVGQYTLLAAELVGSGGRVLAFEADPSIVQILQRNVTLNDLRQVTICDVALSDENDVMAFHPASPRYAGSGSLAAGRYASGEVVSVQARKLDDLLADNTVSRVDLMKIDVEGAELSVLRGSRRAIESYGFPTLIVEFSEHNLSQFGANEADLEKHLMDLGYKIFRIGKVSLSSFQSNTPRDTTYYNTVAIHESNGHATKEIVVCAK
jgi:FkbM family methyltransferase